MPQHLTILVIHHRTPQLLQQCLTRLCEFAPNARIMVVDTARTDAVEDLVHRNFPTVRFLAAANFSMAHAVNLGLKAAGTPFVCHMNADVLVESGTFPALLGVLERPGVGIVGPRCLTRQGRPQNQGLPYRRFYQRLERSRVPSVPVPWLSGCLQVVTQEALQAVGGMDASLRFYNEDMEWCWRLVHAGYACHLVRTDVVHLGGSSTPSTPAFLIEGYRGGYRLSQRYRSRPYRLAHRLSVQVLAAWQQRVQRDAGKRRAYAGIAAMFRRRRFDLSPFGASLADENAAFWREAPPAR